MAAEVASLVSLIVYINYLYKVLQLTEKLYTDGLTMSNCKNYFYQTLTLFLKAFIMSLVMTVSVVLVNALIVEIPLRLSSWLILSFVK
uniref:Uncharacterized protein n=1 Tax=viral metagenome TaxID=1070528 RepID=A0A6C0EBB0_9ZZZZ